MQPFVAIRVEYLRRGLPACCRPFVKAQGRGVLLAEKCISALRSTAPSSDVESRQLVSRRSFHGDSKQSKAGSLGSLSSTTSGLTNIREAAYKLINTGDHPVGDFTSDCWFEVEDMIPFWLTQETPESVVIIFKLLDRLVMEQRHLPTSGPRFDWINSKLLENVVRLWFTVYGRHGLKELQSKDVFFKVQSYVGEFQDARWTASIAAQIGRVHVVSTNGPVRIDPWFCETLIDLTIKEWRDTNKETCFPSSEVFLPAFKSWSYTYMSKNANVMKQNKKFWKDDPLKRFDVLLETMKSLGLEPSDEIYETIIESNAHSETREGALVAHSLVADKILDKARPTKPRSMSMYRAVCSSIEVWPRVTDASSVIRHTELVIRKFTNCHIPGALPLNEGVLLVYNKAIESMAIVGNEESSRKAEKFFDMMKDITNPNDESLFWLAVALAKAGRFVKTHHILASAPTHTFAGYLGLLRGMSDLNHPQLLVVAEDILNMLKMSGTNGGIRADTQTFNMFLESLLGTNDFLNMNWLGKALLSVDVVEFLRASWVRGESDRRPDRQSYSHIIRSWAMVGQPSLAMHWLEEMRNDFGAGRTVAAPHITECNHVLKAYANSANKEEGVVGAQDFLKTISSIQSTNGFLRPTETSYELVLTCLWNKGGREAAQRTKELLAEMKNGGLKPTIQCYFLAMTCWAACHSPEQVEDLLNEMLLAVNELQPTLKAFNCAINAWAISGHHQGAARGERLLSRMMDLRENGFAHLQPDVDTYASLVKAYAVSDQSENSQRAQGLFMNIKKLEEDGMLVHEAMYHELLAAWKHSKNGSRHDLIGVIESHIDRRSGNFPQ